MITPDASWSVNLTGDGGYDVSFEAPIIGVRRRSWSAGAQGKDATSLFNSSRSARALLGSALGAKVSMQPSGSSKAFAWCFDLFEAGTSLFDAYSGGRQGAVREWLTSLTEEINHRLPVIEFRAPFQPPIDLIPALSGSRRSFMRGSASSVVEPALECFMGFRFATRLIANDPSDARPLTLSTVLGDGSVGGRVPITAFTNRYLNGVVDHIPRLGQSDAYQLQAELPGPSLSDGLELAELMTSENLQGCVHLVAHCRIPESVEMADSSELFFSNNKKKRDAINVRMSWLTLTGDDRTGKVESGALGFLIACGAANERLATTASFPRKLLSAGYRCVIAPLVDVQVTPCLLLAEEFYASMARGGCAAAALVEARRQLLTEADCPIGLLFMSYGDTYLQLTE